MSPREAAPTLVWLIGAVVLFLAAVAAVFAFSLARELSTNPGETARQLGVLAAVLAGPYAVGRLALAALARWSG